MVFMTFVFFEISTFAADKSQGAIEIVRPESYSIRRFQEVIRQSSTDEEKSPQEELIAMRAKWVIAQQRLQDLKNRYHQQQLAPPLNESALVKEVHLRSAQAQVDHYAKLVERNEGKILKEKRQQRSKAQKKLNSSRSERK